MKKLVLAISFLSVPLIGQPSIASSSYMRPLEQFTSVKTKRDFDYLPFKPGEIFSKIVEKSNDQKTITVKNGISIILLRFNNPYNISSTFIMFESRIFHFHSQISNRWNNDITPTKEPEDDDYWFTVPLLHDEFMDYFPLSQFYLKYKIQKINNDIILIQVLHDDPEYYNIHPYKIKKLRLKNDRSNQIFFPLILRNGQYLWPSGGGAITQLSPKYFNNFVKTNFSAYEIQ